MSWDPDTAEGDLARFVLDLRAAFPAQAPAAEDAHLAAIMETTHLLADNGDPVARPVSNAYAPVSQVSRLPKRRRNDMNKPRVIRTSTKIAVPLVAAFLVLGAMAAAGALPRSAQHVASRTAGLLGLDVPTGDESGTAGDNQGDNNQDATSSNEQGESGTAGDNQGDNNQDATSSNDQGASGTVGDSGTSGDNSGS